jgi:hypothetical protein
VCKSLSERRIHAHGPSPVGREHHGASASAKRSAGAIAAQAGRLATSHHNRNAPAWSGRFVRHMSANLGRGGNSPAAQARELDLCDFAHRLHAQATSKVQAHQRDSRAASRPECKRANLIRERIRADRAHRAELAQRASLTAARWPSRSSTRRQRPIARWAPGPALSASWSGRPRPRCPISAGSVDRCWYPVSAPRAGRPAR